LVSGFEVVSTDFLYNAAVFLGGGGNVDPATLLGIFGGPGTFEVTARVTDLAGATDSLAFNIDVVVPEPGTFALLSLGLASLASVRRKRKVSGTR